jgi:uncharacterized repeat protein (TIGR01451 family)
MALPAGLVFRSASADQGTYDRDTGLWTIGTLARAASARLTVTAEVSSATPQTVLVTVAADQFDPLAGDNQTSLSETPQSADLALTSALSNTRPNVGDTLTGTITLTNHGPVAASGVAVAVALPPGSTIRT